MCVFRVNGITRELLEDIDVTLEDVHEALTALLPKDAILCGHHISNDLDALQVIAYSQIINNCACYHLIHIIVYIDNVKTRQCTLSPNLLGEMLIKCFWLKSTYILRNIDHEQTFKIKK